jgi:hypothetical protein
VNAGRIWITGLVALLCAAHPFTRADAPPAAPVALERLVVAAADGADLAQVAHDHDLRWSRSLPALAAAVLEAPGARADAALAALRADARVRHAARDVRFEVSGDACCDRPQFELDASTYAAARAEVTRTFGPLRTERAPDVLVAVLDTGVDGQHPDLRGALVGGRSFLADDAAWDEDTSGHGTSMASLVAAVPARDDRGVEGVAPGARVLALKVADRAGLARLADVAAAIVYAVDRGAGVVLLALGTREAAPLLDDALAYAEQRDVLVVAAAGNRNVHTDLQPAADERVLSVGCVDATDRLALSAALAPTTDLLAPGVDVVAALPRGAHAPVTGSSASAARVAGAAALCRALAPDLSAASVRGLLRASRRPLPLFEGHPDVARAFRAGPLDVAALAGALREPSSMLSLADPRVLPRSISAAGQTVVASIRVENRGARASAATEVTVSLAGAERRLPVPALAPGAEALVRTHLAAPAAGEVRFALGALTSSTPLAAAKAPVSDLSLAGVAARPLADGGLALDVVVEGRGAQAEAGAVSLVLEQLELAPVRFAPLGPGEVARVTFDVTAAQARALPDRVVTARVRLSRDGAPADDEAALDLEPPHLSPLRTQYQQGGAVNVIADAPWRLAPARPYLPLLVFVPEKGDLDTSTWLTLDRARVLERSAAAPSGAGRVIYEDTAGGTTTAPAGLVVTDELGQPITRAGAPDPRLFAHGDLDRPGRYTILRLPRDAFAIAPVPARDEVRFVEVDVEWTKRRRFLGLITTTTSGRTRKVLRVVFAAAPRPHLPGSGAYYDAHLHTVAEWTHTDSFDLMAPRKNFGGPIPMVQECALALGLTDALDAARGRVITTDHAWAFYARGAQDDTIYQRPPYGPTSVAASNGRSEWQRMQDLFGLTSSEELAVHSPGTPSNFFFGLQLPLGSHLLKYRGQHLDGPWHGGSALARTLGDPSPDVDLGWVLDTLATTNRAENARAALYAAHPMSDSMGWTPAHYDTAFERDPARRVDRGVHAEQTGFVMKGLQLWNGDGERRSLDPQKIDWTHVNPWADADFVRGHANWDKTLTEGLEHWHGDLAGLLEYELQARPGVRFPRKVFIAAGNDAHGDFNMTESRFAAIVDLKSTYKVSARAFGRVLTYAAGDDQRGAASPEERNFEAFIDGQTILTDGPLATFSVDAEARFDGATLRWTDAAPGATDRDGRIGGGGAFDGEGTALVRRAGTGTRLRYRYTSTDEFGAVTHLSLYRTSVGDPNPVGTKPSGAPLLTARGRLAAGGANLDLEEALDPAEEGLVTETTALHLGAYTGDPATMGADATRALTNPVWLVPYDLDVTVDRTEVDAAGRGSIPPGALRVRLTFDMSLTPRPLDLELKALDATGSSTDGAAGPIDQLAPASGTGWSDKNGVKDCVHEVVNTRAIPLDLDRYPTPADVTFVVYTHAPVQDAFGNDLHRIASTFTTPGLGTGGGTGPAITRAVASTAAPATAAPGVAGGGGGGSSGCTLGGATPTGSGAPAPFALLALALLVAGTRWRAPAVR